MEAVRLGFPLDVTQLLHEFASDRVGVHPTASLWANEVERWDLSDSLVEWCLLDEEGDYYHRHYWAENDDEEDDDIEGMTVGQHVKLVSKPAPNDYVDPENVAQLNEIFTILKIRPGGASGCDLWLQSVANPDANLLAPKKHFRPVAAV